MKRECSDDEGRGAAERGGFRQACLRSCQKVLEAIRRSKEAILAESQERFRAPERLLRLALNEAEALAWQTTYPHLVFPILATEKVQALADWASRQESVRRLQPSLAFVA